MGAFICYYGSKAVKVLHSAVLEYINVLYCTLGILLSFLCIDSFPKTFL